MARSIGVFSAVAVVALASVACSDATVAPNVARDAVELAVFQHRYEVLLFQRAELGDEAFGRRYQVLADEVLAWNERTGWAKPVIHVAFNDCRLTAPAASIGIDPNPPGPGRPDGCDPCPTWPTNAPPGYLCWLDKEICDSSGRLCRYKCIPFRLGGWVEPVSEVREVR